ncbi:hypothetical protein [Pectobacterium versatile]|uniref:hypothetical protein n=1 Tax=Pectobacterium versatile TaxID=2488639 RepID=UPI001F3A3942|nr:hypothetical protein [Pectobacterium versatile]
MNFKAKLYNIFIYFISFFSLFSGVYNFGFGKIYPPLFFAIFGYMFCFYRGKVSRTVFNEYKWFFFIFFIVLYSVLINLNVDHLLVVLRYIFKSILIPLGCYLLIKELILKSSGKGIDTKDLVINAVFFSITAQIILVFLQLYIPSFRDLFFTYIDLADNWKSLSEVGHFRATGLSGLSIYDTSISYGLLLIIIGEWCNSNTLKYNVLFLLSVIITCVLSLIAGRSGFILVVFVAMFYIFLAKNRLAYLAALGGLVFLIIMLTISVIGLDEFYFFSRFVFEPIYAFLDTGVIKTESTNELIDSYLFIPWDVPVLTGLGFWAQPSLSMISGFRYSTDSGLVLYYIAFGVLGVLYLILYLKKFVISYNMKNVNERYSNFSILFFYIVFGLLFIGFLLKAPIFFSEKVMMAYFLWLMYVELKTKNE